jgi:hypothetical protein
MREVMLGTTPKVVFLLKETINYFGLKTDHLSCWQRGWERERERERMCVCVCVCVGWGCTHARVLLIFSIMLHYITLHYITCFDSEVRQNYCRMWNMSYNYKKICTVKLKFSLKKIHILQKLYKTEYITLQLKTLLSAVVRPGN